MSFSMALRNPDSLQEQNKKSGRRESLKLCMIPANHVADILLVLVKEKCVSIFHTKESLLGKLPIRMLLCRCGSCLNFWLKRIQ